MLYLFYVCGCICGLAATLCISVSTFLALSAIFVSTDISLWVCIALLMLAGLYLLALAHILLSCREVP